MINRSAIILFPQDPFEKWINSFNIEGSDKISINDHESRIYLVPNFLEEDGLLNWLQDNYVLMFKKELKVWHDDESSWPELSADNFAHWFELTFVEMVEDLVGDQPLGDLVV